MLLAHIAWLPIEELLLVVPSIGVAWQGLRLRVTRRRLAEVEN